MAEKIKVETPPKSPAVVNRLAAKAKMQPAAAVLPIAPKAKRPPADPPFAIFLSETHPRLRVEQVAVLDSFDALGAVLVQIRAGPRTGSEHYVLFNRLASDSKKLRERILEAIAPWQRRRQPPPTLPAQGSLALPEPCDSPSASVADCVPAPAALTSGRPGSDTTPVSPVSNPPGRAQTPAAPSL